MNFGQLQSMLEANRKPLLEFRAGILTKSGSTVTADPRRGKVQVAHGDDGLLHLKWRIRPSDIEQFDHVLLPRGAVWEEVPECKDGRVFLLRFTQNTGQMRFFWLQEPDSKLDDGIAAKMRQYLDNPPPAQEGLGMGMGGMGGLEGLRGLGGLGEEQAQLLQQLLGTGVRPTPARPAAAAAATAAIPATPAVAAAAPPFASAPSAAVTASNAPQRAALASLGAMAQMVAQQANQPGLVDIFDADRILATGIFDDPAVVAQLLPHLPESQRDPSQLAQNLRSPQLQQTAQQLESVLATEQFAPVMSSFGLPHAGGFGLTAFIGAIQAAADAKRESSEAAEKRQDTQDKKDDGDGEAKS